MESKSVLIIGGSSGIGLACAKLFLQKDFRVYNASRLPCYENGVTNFPLDVKDGDEIEATVKSVERVAGKIDVLIYSAGYSMATPIEKVESEDFEELFKVNLFGAIRAVKSCILGMRENGGGRIILVSSLGGVLPIKYDSFYSASKSAVDMLCYAIRLETEKYNIYTTSLQPGGTVTPFSYRRNVYPEEKVAPYRIKEAVNALLIKEQSGNSPKTVARTIYRTTLRKKPPIVLASGLKNKLFRLVAKFSPKKLLMPILQKSYGD